MRGRSIGSGCSARPRGERKGRRAPSCLPPPRLLVLRARHSPVHPFRVQHASNGPHRVVRGSQTLVKAANGGARQWSALALLLQLPKRPELTLCSFHSQPCFNKCAPSSCPFFAPTLAWSHSRAAWSKSGLVRCSGRSGMLWEMRPRSDVCSSRPWGAIGGGPGRDEAGERAATRSTRSGRGRLG